MVYVVLVVFVVAVVVLTVTARRTGVRTTGCCAPADPAQDARMRSLDAPGYGVRSSGTS